MPVGTKRHTPHRFGVAGQRRADGLAGVGVPHPHRLVGAGGGDPVPVDKTVRVWNADNLWQADDAVTPRAVPIAAQITPRQSRPPHRSNLHVEGFSAR